MTPTPDITPVEVIRLGGVSMLDDIKSLKQAARFISVDPTMLLGLAISQMNKIIDGKNKSEVAKELSAWMSENLASEVGLVYTEKGEDWLGKMEHFGDAVAEMVAQVLFNIKEVMDTSNITNEGKTYVYELIKISDSGAVLLGRHGCDN